MKTGDCDDNFYASICSWSTLITISNEETFFSRFSTNSEAYASEFWILKKMFSWYYLNSNVISMFNYLTICYCDTRCKRVNMCKCYVLVCVQICAVVERVNSLATGSTIVWCRVGHVINITMYVVPRKHFFIIMIK